MNEVKYIMIYWMFHDKKWERFHDTYKAPPKPPTSGSVIVRPNNENRTNNLPRNCVNCGAPLTSRHCEYCDTNY